MPACSSHWEAQQDGGRAIRRSKDGQRIEWRRDSHAKPVSNRHHDELAHENDAATHLRCRAGGTDETGDYLGKVAQPLKRVSLAPMQGANLVAVGIAQVGKIELRRTLTQAGRILDALAAVCDTGIVERLHLLRAVTGKAYRAA